MYEEGIGDIKFDLGAWVKVTSSCLIYRRGGIGTVIPRMDSCVEENDLSSILVCQSHWSKVSKASRPMGLCFVF